MPQDKPANPGQTAGSNVGTTPKPGATSGGCVNHKE